MVFGILFQEYYERKRTKSDKLVFTTLRMVWVIASTLLVMAFIGNLKSSLVVNNYYDQTNAIQGIFDKDLTLHTSPALFDFLKTMALVSPLDKRLFHQANKDDSISISNEYVSTLHTISL